MAGGRFASRQHARRIRDLAAASRRYLPMPSGPTPLSGPLEVVAAWERAWALHDHKALAALFAEDADYVNVVGLWWTSRHSIGRVFKRSFKNEFRFATFTIEKISFRQVGGDGAVLHVRWQITGQVDPDDKQTDPRRGILTLTLERVEDGTWLIVSAQATDIVIAADTNVARGGTVTATSYLPEVPELPEPDEDSRRSR